MSLVILGAISKEAKNILAHGETKSKKQVLSKQVSSEADAVSFSSSVSVCHTHLKGRRGTNRGVFQCALVACEAHEAPFDLTPPI